MMKLELSTSYHKYHVLLILAICVRLCMQNSCEDIVNPSLGDLCLQTPSTLHTTHSYEDLSNSDAQTISGTVLIYYSDNRQSARWGTICINLLDASAPTVMCRQLGYQKAAVTSVSALHTNQLSTVPPWFSYVNCGDDSTKQHILRCNYHVAAPNYKCTVQDLSISCEGLRSKSDQFDGSVWLYPPDGTQVGHQISYGLLLVYLHSQSTWGSINQQPSSSVVFSSHAADSACRQLGYTQADPVSITTVKNSNHTFQNSFTTAPNSWLMTNQTTQCHSSSMPCFTCCFGYPSEKCSNDRKCLPENNIALRCLFDPHIEVIPSEGSDGTCPFLTNRQTPDSCSSGTPLSIILPPAFGGLAIIVVLIISWVVCGIFYKKWKNAGVVDRGENQPLVQPPNVRPNVPPRGDGAQN